MWFHNKDLIHAQLLRTPISAFHCQFLANVKVLKENHRHFKVGSTCLNPHRQTEALQAKEAYERQTESPVETKRQTGRAPLIVLCSSQYTWPTSEKSGCPSKRRPGEHGKRMPHTDGEPVIPGGKGTANHSRCSNLIARF